VGEEGSGRNESRKREDEGSSECMSHSQALTCVDSLLHYMEQWDYNNINVITVKTFMAGEESYR
jgi:hypothetical protein